MGRPSLGGRVVLMRRETRGNGNATKTAGKQEGLCGASNGGAPGGER
jgi:hypothetical protein